MEFLELTMNEVHTMRLMSKTFIAKEYNDGTKWLPGLVIPETSVEYEEVLVQCWKGNMDGLRFGSDSDIEYESDGEENPDDDTEDDDSDALIAQKATNVEDV